MKQEQVELTLTMDEALFVKHILEQRIIQAGFPIYEKLAKQLVPNITEASVETKED